MRRILKEGEYELRIDLQDWEKETRYAKYNKFNLGDSASNYKLEVLGYSGNAGVVYFYNTVYYVFGFCLFPSVFVYLFTCIGASLCETRVE